MSRGAWTSSKIAAELTKRTLREKQIAQKAGKKAIAGSDVTKGSQVCSWGMGCFGGLGNSDFKPNHFPLPIKILNDTDVIQIANGWTQSLAISGDGQLFSWGWHRQIRTFNFAVKCRTLFPRLYAQLQRRKRKSRMFFNDVTKSPLRIPTFGSETGIFAKQISCGAEHFAVVTTDGNLYTWGTNMWGQLAQPETIDFSHVSEPLSVDILRQHFVTKVECGFNFTLALMSDGGVYSWGKRVQGALGLDLPQTGDPKIHRLLSTPTCLQDQKDCTNEWRSAAIIDMSCGFSHSLFLDDRGRVWSCGKNGLGQLGHSDFRYRRHPTQISALQGKRVIAIAAGLYHSVVLTEEGEVFTWGANRCGQLMRSLDEVVINTDLPPRRREEMKSIPSPGLIKIEKKFVACGVKKIFAGNYDTVLVDNNGMAIVAGGNNNPIGYFEPYRLVLPGEAHSFAFGFNHALAITLDHARSKKENYQKENIL